jgi:predicted Na+-dependent transporter
MKRKPAEFAAALNKYIERFMPLLTPAGVILGFGFPRIFIQLRPFIPWLFSAVTLAGALKLRAGELAELIKKPLPAVFFFLTSHVVMPGVVLFMSGLIFQGDADTISGYILLYAMPTAVSGFIWVSIFRGDSALSLAVILLDTLAAPLVVPGTVSLLLGTKVALDMTGMTVSLVLMVVVPTIIGIGLNELSRGEAPRLISPYLTPFSKFCVLSVIAANTAAVAPQIDFQSPRVWIISASCILFSGVGFICAKVMGILGRFNREKKVSIFFASALRNTSAAMTIAIEFFPAAAALPAVLGIIFQQTMAAIMGKVLRMGDPGEKHLLYGKGNL